jgi:hypothetical protein
LQPKAGRKQRVDEGQTYISYMPCKNNWDQDY